ncbi:MAG: bifunctional adenosylcobinamide kinase/adenosylcobinamide-phosphate guanylyltransferase [Gammaproteobacteria bacterium]|nr:bifunctional adenosylcobinamide kinase/adenosylcobinamide-phosphate guanylyltransferase [Gammaproteobacteria bacterium]
MADLSLVLGGARSGKSRYAESRLARHRGQRIYLATAEPGDAEMAARIAAHRRRRGTEWRTVEEPLELAATLALSSAPRTAILVDCLTLWLANLMGAKRDLAAETSRLLEVLGGLDGTVVLVANEVGLGIVPDNAEARRFRDAAGILHQDIAKIADEVVLVAAGIPLTLKTRKREKS